MKAKYNRIGTAKDGIGEHFHLSYVGPRTDLKGFTAKVRLVRAPYRGCVAQFNSSRTGYHFGWFRFKIMDFYGWPAESLSNEALLREVSDECRKSVIDVHPRSRNHAPNNK